MSGLTNKNICISVDNIPYELKVMSNWVCWKAREELTKEGEFRTIKIPINPCSGRNAMTNNKSTWASLEVALKRLEFDGTLRGVGFMFSDGIVGIDIDHCLKNGELSEIAKEIISTLSSYTEISPSGSGIHIFCSADIPNIGRKNKEVNLEIYNNNRFFTFTTNLWGIKKDVENRTEEVKSIVSKYFPVKDQVRLHDNSIYREIRLDVNEILQKALESKDRNFTDLYNGNTGKYNNDWSRADLAFCNKLAFWCNKDKNLMDSIFRSSRLYRVKWDEKHGSKTYGELTLEKAIASCKEVYNLINRGDR